MPRYTLLRHGWVVQGNTAAPMEILIADERIAAVSRAIIPPDDTQVVDVSGLLVLPGLIDVHVHLREPGGEHQEDFTSGTRAALAGGVTTVLAMPNTDPPLTDRATLERALALAQAKAVCDFGLLVGATPENAALVAEIPEAAGLKLYMGASTGSLLVADFAAQWAHFTTYPPDRVLAVHAEDEEAVRHFARQGERRPPLCAALAVARALTLAEAARRRLHICHLSTAQELALVQAAKARGLPVTCEVTPHHLFLSREDEARLGPLGKMNPPLREREEVEALWAGLDGVDCIATDHAPHTLEEKAQGMEAAPAGVPGLETMLPLLLTAFHQGRLTLETLIRLTSSGPARVYGLARKGRLAPGYDADLTLVALDERWQLSDEGLFTRCGWTPFAGREVKGRVRRVYLRGRLAYADGEVLVEPGYGRRVEIAA